MSEGLSLFAVFTANQNTYEIQLTTFVDDLEEEAETIELVLTVSSDVEIRALVVILNGKQDYVLINSSGTCNRIILYSKRKRVFNPFRLTIAVFIQPKTEMTSESSIGW